VTKNLHVVVRGIGSPGTPTVFIHGVGSNLGVWTRVQNRLSGLGPLVSFDLRGHGNSGTPPGPWELDDFVSDFVRLLTDLGIARANVVGFSLGGLITQAIAARVPERVARVVIMGAVAGRTDAEREAVLERLALVEREGPAGVAARGSARWYTEEFAAAHPETVNEHLTRLGENDRKGYAAAYRVLATSDLIDELSRIRAPTLIVTGEHDVGSPPHMSEAMGKRIPNSHVVIVSGQRHAMLEECPEHIADLIAPFLASESDGRNGRASMAPGMVVRREVLGDEYVDRALEHQDEVSLEFQSFLTSYCWGEIWTDSRLSRRDRSILTLGMTAALGRMREFEAHSRGALRNGLTPAELTAALKQIAVYCGVPAGVAAAVGIRNAVGELAIDGAA
jgi:pimeloyl-ACP methyl ester carboxylesterase/alkylhydroperoxidase/carboxymuconolactone decarboxylase family protein YurZ